MTGVNSSVSAVDTMASHFRKINQRLASLERMASSAPALQEARIAQLETQVAALQAIVNPPPS